MNKLRWTGGFVLIAKRGGARAGSRKFRDISHMAMECVAYNVYVRLLTFNIFM